MLCCLIRCLSYHPHLPPSPFRTQSGEESAEQITARAERMGVTRASSIALLCETDMDVVLSAMASLRPRCVIVDSIQTMYLEEAGAFAGSTTQIRECARAANRVAKETGAPVFLVGHVTKASGVGDGVDGEVGMDINPHCHPYHHPQCHPHFHPHYHPHCHPHCQPHYHPHCHPGR